MSRLNSVSVMARARELIDAWEPRSFIDARAVDEPLEWSEAPRPTVVLPPNPLIDGGLQIAEDELHEATVQSVLLILCGNCQRRHWEPRAGLESRNPFFRCTRCGAMNSLPAELP